MAVSEEFPAYSLVLLKLAIISVTLGPFGVVTTANYFSSDAVISAALCVSPRRPDHLIILIGVV